MLDMSHVIFADPTAMAVDRGTEAIIHSSNLLIIVSRATFDMLVT